jgi:hypothetical protein
MKDYNDYEQYHFDWVYKLEGEGFKMEAIKIAVRMNSSSNFSSEKVEIERLNLVNSIKDKLSDKNNKEMISEGIYLIGQWKLWEHLDIVEICESLVEVSTDNIVNLLGKKSELDQETKTKHSKTLIENLLKKNPSKFIKTCDALC